MRFGGMLRLVLSLASGMLIAIRAFANSETCDLACLTAMTDSYLAALVAHDPSRLPLTPNATFTENAIRSTSTILEPGRPRGSGRSRGVTLDLAETFKIKGGKIHEMESVWMMLRYRTQPGW